MSSLSHRNHLRPSLWTVSQGTEGCRDAKTFKTFLLGWTYILLDKFRRRTGHHDLYIFAVRCYIVSSLSVDVNIFVQHIDKRDSREVIINDLQKLW